MAKTEIKIIDYYTKNVYGRKLIYIADKEIARNVNILSGGKKTLTVSQLKALVDLGFGIQRVVEKTGEMK